MIFITGDCHGDWKRFSKARFPEQKKMNRDDYVIITGDFGLWTDDEQERWCLDELSNRSFTTLFIDGNHENFDRLYSDEFEEIDFQGGRAHKIRDNIYHLERGYVFDVDGRAIFAFGGAPSHDVQDGILDPADFDNMEDFKKKYRDYRDLGLMFRVKGWSWWPEEMPSEEEMERGLKNLEEHGNRVDFVVTHCPPSSILPMCTTEGPNELTDYFDKVAERIEFRKWYFGHYHQDRAISDKYIILYKKIMQIN